MSVVAKAAKAVGDVIGGAVEAVGSAVQKIGKVVVDTAKYVADNPIIVAIAVGAPYAVKAIGTSFGASSSAIKLATAPVTAGAITAAQGGSLEDIGKSALGAFAGNVAGAYVGETVGKAIGASNPTQAALASTAGGAAAGAASALATGGNVGQSAILGAAGSLGASLARSEVAQRFGLDPRGSIAEAAADVGEAVGRTAGGGGTLGQELAGAAFSTAQREGSAAFKGLTTPSDAEVASAIRQPVRTEQSTAVEINDDIYNAITDRKNAVQVAFQGPVTPEQIQQLARNASLDLIETWKAKAAADPTFARELAKPENLNAIRAAGLVELATAVTSLTSVAAGGIGATALATGQLAAPGSEVLRQAMQENPMLGAMGGDASFAGALIDVWANTPTRTAVDTTPRLPTVEVTASPIEPSLTPQQYKDAVQRYIGDFAQPTLVDAPVTADVARVAQILNITNKQASALKNSPIFDYLTNQSVQSKSIDIDTLPLRERALIEYAATTRQGGVSLNEDFNVIIPGKNISTPTVDTGRLATTAPRTQTQTQTQRTTQAGTQTGTRTGTRTGTQTRTGTEVATATLPTPDTETARRPMPGPESEAGGPTRTGAGTEAVSETRPREKFKDGGTGTVETMTGTDLLATEAGGKQPSLVEQPVDLANMTTDELIEYLNQQFPLTEQQPETEGVIDVRGGVRRDRRQQAISPRVVGVAPVAAIIGEKEPIFGGEPDPQQDVWNVRSLRLRRALGL